MRIFDKYRAKTKGNGRYFELDGLRFHIGIDFIINLTKAYNEKYSIDATIEEVIAKCLGQSAVTVEAIELLNMAILISLNTQCKLDGKDLYSDEFVKDLYNSKSMGFVGKIAYNLRMSVVSLMLGEGEEAPNNDDEKKKD